MNTEKKPITKIIFDTDIGGDWAAIQKSLKRLASMDADFRVFPGHGESTTLDNERMYNPYMRDAL